MNTFTHKQSTARTNAENANKTEKRKCWRCKGYGELKSYCDAPDRTCPACEGTGEDRPL